MSTTFGPPIPLIEKDIDAIIQAQSTITLPHFTATDAWEIGSSIRTRLLHHPKAVLISIILANQQPLFLATNHSGTSPDNSVWVSRKQKTVLRWGVPSFQMGAKFKGDEVAFAAKNALIGVKAGEYAIHGGAVPIFVEGVEGLVAVVTVSGLAQEEDHGVVVEALRKFKESSAPKV